MPRSLLVVFFVDFFVVVIVQNLEALVRSTKNEHVENDEAAAVYSLNYKAEGDEAAAVYSFNYEA